MTNHNALLARRWFEEVWNQRRVETIEELLTPSSTCESEAGILRGPDEFRSKVHQPLLSAFPDLRITIEGTVAEGDQVVSLDGCRHAHRRRPWPARHGTARHDARMTWIRFLDGKMHEGVDCWNQRELMESLK